MIKMSLQDENDRLKGQVEGLQKKDRNVVASVSKSLPINLVSFRRRNAMLLRRYWRKFLWSLLKIFL
jgi:hypothetical protein